jgi:hypothetical protein
MLLFGASPAAAGLFGPPKFKVSQSDDRFSTDGATTFAGQWNRISKKSLAGGVHIDDMGVFVEPMVIKDRASGKILKIEFLVHNEVSEDSAGLGNQLAFGQLQRITFLADNGPPIALTIRNGDREQIGGITYNTVSRMASTHVSESGFAELTEGDFQRIMAAGTLLVKVEGSRRSMVYEARDVAKSFQENLRSFWKGYVQGRAQP